MVRLICFIRPHLLESVKLAIAALQVGGLSVSDVRGVGNSADRTDWIANEIGQITLPIRTRIEVVVPDEKAESVVCAIERSARTGEPGDGKIFMERIEDAVRIRTQEYGQLAL